MIRFITGVFPGVQFTFPNGFTVSVIQQKYPSGRLRFDSLVFNDVDDSKSEKNGRDNIDAVALAEILNEVSKRPQTEVPQTAAS